MIFEEFQELLDCIKDKIKLDPTDKVNSATLTLKEVSILANRHLQVKFTCTTTKFWMDLLYILDNDDLQITKDWYFNQWNFVFKATIEECPLFQLLANLSKLFDLQ